MLHYYELDSCYEIVREWYDGYRFGNTDVYCPWDVINYCSDHLLDVSASPKNYWMNTSGNDVINHFIDSMDTSGQLTRRELETLVSGGTVQKEIHEELTHRELYSTIDNLWSTLVMTGYLTQKGKSCGNFYELAIPNREVRNIIMNCIMNRFKAEVNKDGDTLRKFCDALSEGKPEVVEQIFREYMKKTISVRDTFVKKNGDMEKECQKAIQQIDDKKYTEFLQEEGIQRIMKYGIACRKKDCRVLMEKEELRLESE